MAIRSGEGGVPGDEELRARIQALEARLDDLAGEVVTSRLVVIDDLGRRRLVAAASGPAAELRVMVAGTAAGRSTEVSIFAVEGDQGGLPGGVGVQLWADGSVVGELTTWDDDPGTPSPVARPAGPGDRDPASGPGALPI